MSWAACSGSACLEGEYRVSLSLRGQWTWECRAMTWRSKHSTASTAQQARVFASEEEHEQEEDRYVRWQGIRVVSTVVGHVWWGLGGDGSGRRPTGGSPALTEFTPFVTGVAAGSF
jgi:hypothetical protein